MIYDVIVCLAITCLALTVPLFANYLTKYTDNNYQKQSKSGHYECGFNSKVSDGFIYKNKLQYVIVQSVLFELFAFIILLLACN